MEHLTSKDKWVTGEGRLDEKSLLEDVEVCAKVLQSDSLSQQLTGSQRFYDLIMMVWSLDTSLAMDAAELVCNKIRENGGLAAMLMLLSTADEALLLQVCKGIEQIMTSSNRQFITEHSCFEALVEVACSQAGLESIQCGTGILENLFKHSMDTCLYLIQNKALEGVLKGCRSMDVTILQHCAAALANCAMYGGQKCQVNMIAQHADHWLFPLAFSQDIVVKYYALLAIAFLASNPDLEMKVERSGTLDLVLPYLQSQDPEEFPKKCLNHAHGRSASWLKRLVPLLQCGNEEARSLSAFHFAMEASVKKKQQRLQVFYEIGAIDHLYQSAKTGSRLTSEFCCQALLMCGECVPVYQCWNVLNWDPNAVKKWVHDIGLGIQPSTFSNNLVTGSLLLDMTVEDLDEFGLSRVKSRWFLDQVLKLRYVVDVSNKDRHHICKWLMGISKDLARYRVDFIKHGVCQSLLPHLTDDLLQEVGVHRSLDRLKLLLAIKEFCCPPGKHSTDSAVPMASVRPLSPSCGVKSCYDVFISYRRANGSQLASLLKVYLQLKGLSVFLDVEELGSGYLDEAILATISRSNSLVLVLSPDALDRCKSDATDEDWVHHEVRCALDHQVPIVPLLDSQFHWPDQSELPADLKQVCTLNGVVWSHQYQDASVSKLINFLPPTVTRHRNIRTSF